MSLSQKLVNGFVDGLNAFSSSMSTRQSQSLRLSNPELSRILGVHDYTKSGVTIDHGEVMALPAVMRAVSIISSTVASVPFKVLKLDGDREVEARGHTSFQAVAGQPNEEFTQYTFRETMTSWAMLWGNAVAYIDAPNWPHGNVTLIPLLPDRTRIARVNRNMVEEYDIDPLKEGEIYYITHVDGIEKTFHQSQCFHLRGLGPNPYWGWDIVKVLRETFGGAKAASEFGHRFYGQGANPAGFIESPIGLSPEAAKRFAESLNRGLSGLGKSHRMMLLEEGAKFHQWTVDPDKAQYLEGKQYNVREIAMALGIKVHKLIDGAGTSYNSLSESNKEHKDDDITPWLMRWMSQYNCKLLTADQKSRMTHRIGFDDEYMEYVSFSDRARGTVELLNNGIINKDEARRNVNYGPSKEDENSDRFRKPLNIGWEDEENLIRGTTGQAPPQTDTVEVPEEDESDESEDVEENATINAPHNDDLSEMIEDYMAREVRRLRAIALQKSAKGGKVFLSWLETIEAPIAPKPVQNGVQELYSKAIEKLNEIADSACEDELAEVVKNTFFAPGDDDNA